MRPITENDSMGKGDLRTEKGKRRRGTHGKRRPKKVKKAKPAGSAAK